MASRPAAGSLGNRDRDKVRFREHILVLGQKPPPVSFLCRWLHFNKQKPQLLVPAVTAEWWNFFSSVRLCQRMTRFSEDVAFKKKQHVQRDVTGPNWLSSSAVDLSDLDSRHRDGYLIKPELNELYIYFLWAKIKLPSHSSHSESSVPVSLSLFLFLSLW